MKIPTFLIFSLFSIFIFPVSVFSTTSWTSAEDEILRVAVAIQGAKKWSTIAERLPAKIGKQCRERYMNHLDPTVDKSDFTEAERELLCKMIDQHTSTKEDGKKEIAWAEIAKSFRQYDPTTGTIVKRRTDLFLKNHRNSSIHKAERKNRTWTDSRKKKRDSSSIQTDESITDNVPSSFLPLLPSVFPLVASTDTRNTGTEDDQQKIKRAKIEILTQEDITSTEADEEKNTGEGVDILHGHTLSLANYPADAHDDQSYDSFGEELRGLLLPKSESTNSLYGLTPIEDRPPEFPNFTEENYAEDM
ncbi:MAG: Myb-like DNA-binding domain-containing protein [Pseudomonadota bacterium]|jgi:hypothetical protein|nr:hypothetical protein [Alphaproteobacteria bacterium]